MQLKNCAECGKLFLHQLGDLCPACVAQEEENFKQVREYLYNTRATASNVDELSDMTGVSAKRIIKFIRQGRLQFAKIYLNCENCGTPIEEGRYCQDCKAKMLNSLHTGGDEEPVVKHKSQPGGSKGNKMFTADLTSRGRK